MGEAGQGLVRGDWDLGRGVATLTLDSVANRNALSLGLLDELLGLLRRADADAAIKVVVLRAEGPAFCAGADLAAAGAGSMTPVVERIVEAQRVIVTMGTPVVARVHGAVRAGGLGLVAAADIAIGAVEGTYALTEVRLGLAAAAVSLTVLARLSPRAGSDYLLSGRVFDGAAAERAGLLTRAVPEAELDDAVDAVVGELLLGSAQGLREAKRLVNEDVARRLREEGPRLVALSAELFASEEAQGAMAAVLSRRRSRRSGPAPAGPGNAG